MCFVSILNSFDLFISLFNNRLGTGESQEWGLSGRVQRVGLMGWVKPRPLICLAPSALFWRVSLNFVIRVIRLSEQSAEC